MKPKKEKEWRPKEGEKYWYITFSVLGIFIQDTKFSKKYSSDVLMLKEGNYFKTKKAAEKALKRILIILKYSSRV